MSPKKGAAQAAPAKKRARSKEPRRVPEHLLVPVDAGDWPTNLDDKKAADLFAMIECGATMKKAAEEVGLEYNTVAQWKRRHRLFTERMEEAIDIGIDAMIDEGVAISDTAKDRDTAAAAKERREGRRDYRRDRRPERFHINPFKPAAGGGDGAALLGIVLVPMKVTQSQGDRPVIEGSAVRVPNKTLP